MSARASPAEIPARVPRDPRARPDRRLRAPPRPAAAGRRAAPARLPRRHDRQLRAGFATALPAHRLAGLLGPDDHLLLGTDLVKDHDTLVAAYDDAAGVTAEFNRNILHVLNRELAADFDPDAFAHVARFDTDEPVDRDAAARERGAARVTIADLDLTVSLKPARKYAHRDQRQVHARARRRRVDRRRPRARGLAHRRARVVRAVTGAPRELSLGPPHAERLRAAGRSGPGSAQSRSQSQPQRWLAAGTRQEHSN